ncbi:MAG: OmpH family outer membrane protein [Muribaculaceae bacterium]|nr:OmpH family outer membrane protein [Muribaculaceae bacterium]MDE6526737.1 OmpH family outer membrane protein [Muribaculaceae bacterium]MDE6611549.1 OmpH family outer membrane protein [Muribaculaceae bacterium]
MKKLSFTVKSFLSLAVVVAAASCSDKSAKTEAEPTASTDTEAAPAVVTNIRYIDADSVMREYKLAQQLLEEQQREVNRLQQWHESKQRELQNMANNIGQKQQNNIYLSQASMDADVQSFQKKGQEAENYLNTQQQRLAQADLAIRARLSDSINNFVRDYNATRGYDAILLREAGVYFNPALDITAEIIEGLNARLQPEASK